MTMVPLGGIIGSAAGAPLSQSAGAETERAQKESAAQQRQVDVNAKAELAAGIGQTHEDQESSERDADGRRPWEIAANAKNGANGSTGEAPRLSKDSTGQSGNQLDLMG